MASYSNGMKSTIKAEYNDGYQELVKLMIIGAANDFDDYNSKYLCYTLGTSSSQAASVASR